MVAGGVVDIKISRKFVCLAVLTNFFAYIHLVKCASHMPHIAKYVLNSESAYPKTPENRKPDR